MASSLVHCIFFLSFLVAVEVCHGRSLTDDHVVPNSAEKVPVELYYESLCPGCQEFVLEGLPPLFKTGLIDIVQLKLVPWGNAKVYPNKSFVCQHGPPECFLNMVEACAIGAWPTTKEHFPFISCVEGLASQGKHTKWESCFKELRMDPKEVKHCSSTQLGTEIELTYAAETYDLVPPLEFVPWVVVNGQPIKMDIGNLINYICKAYKGIPPSVCHDKSSSILLREQTPHVYPVCFASQDHDDIHPTPLPPGEQRR